LREQLPAPAAVLGVLDLLAGIQVVHLSLQGLQAGLLLLLLLLLLLVVQPAVIGLQDCHPWLSLLPCVFCLQWLLQLYLSFRLTAWKPWQLALSELLVHAAVSLRQAHGWFHGGTHVMAWLVQ
jgi:hypothetical protein